MIELIKGCDRKHGFLLLPLSPRLIPATVMQPISTSATHAASLAMWLVRRISPIWKEKHNRKRNFLPLTRIESRIREVGARVGVLASSSTACYMKSLEHWCIWFLDLEQAGICHRFKHAAASILEENMLRVEKNKPRCTWPSQFAMQARGLEQEPMVGTQPIYNQLLQNSRTEHSYFLYSKLSMLTHIKLMASHNLKNEVKRWL